MDEQVTYITDDEETEPIDDRDYAPLVVFAHYGSQGAHHSGKAKAY